MLVIMAGIHKMLARIAKEEDPDQTVSSEAVSIGPRPFCEITSVPNFRTFTICAFHYMSLNSSCALWGI